MSLKIKTLCILLGLMIVYVAINGAIHRFIFKPGFLYLEKREAEKNLNRPLDALRNELDHLSVMANDWASWDDTYGYMNTKDAAYRASNLEPMETYQVNRLNLMLYCSPGGRIVWRRTVDFKTGKDIPLPEIPAAMLSPGHPLMGMAESNTPGFMKTSHGPLMVSARPILTSTNQGPSRGVLVLGRFLSDKVIQDMAAQTGVPFTLVPLESARVSGNPELRQLARGDTRRFMDSGNRDSLYLYSLFRDISGAPLFLIKATMPRELLKKGLETLNFSMISTVAASVLMLLLTIYLLHRTILSPISELTRHAVEVEETGDFTAPINMKRNDEIGVLAQRYDSMLKKLSEIRSELLNQAYNNGLAGIASDVLHHSGNILMPMAQGISALRALYQSVPFERAGKALDELEQGPTDPEREKNLKRFLNLSNRETRRIFDEALSVIQNLESLSKELEQIMGGLEKFSRRHTPARPLLPEALIREAVARLPETLKKDGIAIHPSMGVLPAVKAEPLILVQVFMTLFSHAATLGAACPTASIQVSGKTEPGSGGFTLVHFSVTVTGVETPAEQMATLFARIRSGHPEPVILSSLHWCSNVVSAMGGTLSCSSDSQTTVFHLTLPQAEVTHDKK